MTMCSAATSVLYKCSHLNPMMRTLEAIQYDSERLGGDSWRKGEQGHQNCAKETRCQFHDGSPLRFAKRAGLQDSGRGATASIAYRRVSEFLV